MKQKYIFLSIITILILIFYLVGCKKSVNDSNSCINTPSTIYSPLTSNDIINMQKEQELINKQGNSKNTSNIPTPYNCSEIEYKTFNLANIERTKDNKSALAWSNELYAAALTRAKELPKKFSHTRPDGSSFFTVSKVISGENIAYGYPTADKVLDGWMNSPGHRANILNQNYTKTAIALYEANNNEHYYWCQLFGY